MSSILVPNPVSNPGLRSFSLHQRGVTLIEILITLLVLSIGLLGLAAMQGFSLQAGHTSYLRSQATSIGYEVTDFARANRSVADKKLLKDRAEQLVDQHLPDGAVNVTFSAATGELEITISWLDDRSELVEESARRVEYQYETRI